MPDIPEKKRADYTEGSILTAILKMGLPSMFGFLTANIYRIVDTWWVSQLPDGENAVAGLTFFGTILWLLFSFNMLVGPGSVAIISRRYGEKAYDAAEKAIKESLILKLFFGFLFGGVGLVLLRPILVLLGAEGEALELGFDYGQIMLIGLAFNFAVYTIFTALRGVANPNLAMTLMLASTALNMILDPLFIFGYAGFPAMGVKGAAIASFISIFVTLVAGLIILYGDYANIKLHLRGKLRISVSSMWTIVKIGIPAWLGDFSFSGARLIIVPIVATFGTNVVAAYGVGNLITETGVMILVGIGMGLSALIGQTLGSGKTERAKQTAVQSIYLGIGIMTLFGLAVFFFAEETMKMFFSNLETIAVGTVMLKIYAVGFPFFGAFLMISEIHMGVGLNSPAMVINFINSWVLEVIPIYFFTQHFGFGVTIIWWTIVVALAISSFIFYVYYRRGRWLNHSV
ncbi:MAG: MATE family efflux transporter [candidate division Zixibacteria bacterium]